MTLRPFDNLPDYVTKAMANSNNTGRISAGIHTEMIKDRPAVVEKKMQDFYNRMYKNYPTFEVLNTTSSPIPTGVCMYITYRI